jgi:hypothetical protein
MLKVDTYLNHPVNNMYIYIPYVHDIGQHMYTSLRISLLKRYNIRQLKIQETKWAINNEQSRDTGNIGYTRHRTKTSKAKNKTQKKKKDEQYGQYSTCQWILVLFSPSNDLHTTVSNY